MNRYLICASLLLVASCSKEPAEGAGEQNSGTQVSLTASLTDAQTRVAANYENSEKWTFEWEEGDNISGWYAGVSAPEKFTMLNHDAQASTFEGSVLDDQQYRFIYHYTDNIPTIDGYCYITLYEQTDKELEYTYMINDKLIDAEDIINGTVTDLSMKHLGGFMVVDIYLENAQEGKSYELIKVRFSSEDDLISAYAAIDMTKEVDDEELYASTTPGTISAFPYITFGSSDDPDYLQAITRMNIIPFEVAAEQSVTVDIIIDVYDTETKEYLESFTSAVTIKNNSGATLPFARATHNYTYLTIDGNKSAAQIVNATLNGWGEIVDCGDLTLEYPSFAASEIDADNVPAINSWTISDSGEITHDLLEGVRAALLVAEAEGRSISISMPNATEIGDYAFAFKTYYDEGVYASSGCPALTAIELPNVTTIGDFAFAYSGFTSFNFEGVTEIGEAAFLCCSNLSEVTNFSLTSIPGSAFLWCGFTSFDFEGVTEVGEQAFSANMSLTEVKNFEISTIPYGLFMTCPFTSFDFTWVTEIGGLAFATCSYLTEIELPSTVTSIGEYAFSNCYYLATVTLNWTGDEILAYDSSWFMDTNKLTTIYIPSGTKADYVTMGWSSDLLVEKEQ